MNGFQKMNRSARTAQDKQHRVAQRRLGYLQLDLAVNERAFLYRNRLLVDVLGPGRHRYFDAFENLDIQLYDIGDVTFTHEALSVLYQTHAPLLEQHLLVAQVGPEQAGLVYRDGLLSEVLAPGSFAAFWKGAANIDVHLVSVAENIRVEAKLAKDLAHRTVAGANAAALITEVQENHVGLLTVDGRLVESLDPGLHGFWRFGRSIAVQQVDLRMQALDVQGQEILTKDKVSLRVNLSATFNIVDAVKAAQSVQDLRNHLYRDLQLGLREAVGTRRLDELLGNKDEINSIVSRFMQDKATDVGVWLDHVGVKDIILPGEMKTILNQVVEAEKAAQANVIKRREETAATRSLLNTAKVMEDNPVLLRLKELESLEKVVEKVGALNVYGGLDSVMDDLVRIRKL